MTAQICPSIAVLIVNYFSVMGVQSLITSLAASDDSEYLDIVVVDNSCDEREWAKVVALPKMPEFHSYSVVRSERNSGYAGGNNLAFSHAPVSSEWIAVINPDVTLEQPFSLVAALAEADPASIHVPLEISENVVYSGTSAIRKWTARSRRMKLGEPVGRGGIRYPDGHFFVVAASKWREMNGLDEMFFLYCEELDLALRTRMTIRSIDSLRVKHIGGATTGSAGKKKSTVTAEHASRSRILLYRRHAELRSYLPSVILFRFAYAIRLLMGGNHRAASAAIAGMAEALFQRLDRS